MKFKSSITILVIIFLISCQSKKQEKTVEQASVEKVQPAAAVNDLPNLKVEDVNGSTLQLQDLTGEIALIFFNPDCEHCQHQAQLIGSKKDLFKNQQLYFITAEPAQAINKFITDYQMKEANYHFSHANPAEVFSSVGNFAQMPTIFTFKDKKKLARFEGTTPVEDIANVFTVK